MLRLGRIMRMRDGLSHVVSRPQDLEDVFRKGEAKTPIESYRERQVNN